MIENFLEAFSKTEVRILRTVSAVTGYVTYIVLIIRKFNR